MWMTYDINLQNTCNKYVAYIGILFSNIILYKKLRFN